MTAPGSAPPYLAIGRIGRPHGLRGEVQVELLTDFPERFAPGARVYVGPEDMTEPTATTVTSARAHQARLLVTFGLASDREAGARLTGLFVYIPTDQARPLGPDAYYAHQLVGLEVVTEDGAAVGVVTGLLEAGETDVLHVQDGARVILIPMIGELIAQIDLATGRITICPIPGLLEG